MSVEVLLTDGAARDLDELVAAAYDRGGALEADRFLDRIEVALGRVAAAPAAGRPLPALLALGVTHVRQVREGAWRVVYRRDGGAALVVAIAREGRSLASLLERRLLDS